VSNAYHDESPSGPLHASSTEAPGLNPPPPLPIEHLREIVRRARAERGLSINDVMMRSGLSRTATLDLLNGRGRIACGRLDTWWALAWSLDVPLSELLRELEDTGPATHPTTHS